MLFEATMESATCHVVYVNRSVRADRHVRADSTATEGSHAVVLDGETSALKQDIDLLLTLFGEAHLCSTGAACLAKVYELQKYALIDLKPTLVLIDMPHDEQILELPTRSRSPSPRSRLPSGEVEIHTPDEDVYGLKLLQRIVTATHLQPASKLIVPIPVVTYPSNESNAATDGAADELAVDAQKVAQSISVPRRLIFRCMELGAIDIMRGPLQTKCMTGLEILAYRAHKEAVKDQQSNLEVRRGRKRSWVGINEEKPYAYLREAMVSGLMGRICRHEGLDDQERIANVSIAVSTERQAAIAEAVGHWHFCAHAFTDDELLIASMIMFKHALSMPELERWRIPTDQLLSFLVACRGAYNDFVPYHNFRHVVDVLQATFNFLVHIGTLSTYPQESVAQDPPPEKSPIASLLHPFDGLTLLITAIGHDVGHPGVNNGFLVTLNAPLAQLYNDRSVLESFHCAAYSQILRSYWPAAFEDTKMRNLMISSILATDMGLHFDYMKKLGDLQEKLGVSNTTDGWNGRMMEEQKALACSLLIKCADISNVARNHSTALQWMHILSDEFSRQASMESELAITSSLLATPKKDITSLSKAQLGFMNMFAIPLFQGVADIMPAMQYTVDELELNKVLFEEKIEREKAKEDPVRKRLLHEGTFSPRTMSFAVDVSQKEAPITPPEDAQTPSALVDGKKSPEKELAPPPSDPVSKPAHVPDFSGQYKEVNGMVTNFDAVADFAASDPFHSRERLNSCSENHTHHNGKQRCSETTDGSTTGPYSGDWASQATSATTGKMPLSPSTQGTSIVSRESTDRPLSVPTNAAESVPEIKLTPEPKIGTPPSEEEYNGSNYSNGSVSKAEGKLLKKKSSRFRMNAFPFFRRHRGSSPPIPAADTAG